MANADARTVIVSFKGTNPASLKNWLANLDFSVVPYDASVPGAMVHEGAHCDDKQTTNKRHVGFRAGFFDSYVSMKADMFSALRNLTSLYPHWPVAFTGHSLGGSHALFAALDFVRYYNNSVSLYGCNSD